MIYQQAAMTSVSVGIQIQHAAPDQIELEQAFSVVTDPLSNISSSDYEKFAGITAVAH